MVQMKVQLAVAGVLACSACAAAQGQVAGREVAVQPGEEASYTDPWGTSVTWSAVPAPSSPPGTPAGTETEEAKPKVEEETPPPQPEPETTVTTVNLSGDEDGED